MGLTESKGGFCVKWIMLGLAAELLPLALPGSAAATATCEHLKVKASVVVGDDQLTLADLLSSDTCPPLRNMAARVSVGLAPLAGTVRVLERSQVRRSLEALAAANGLNHEWLNQEWLDREWLDKEIEEDVPARIVVERGGENKSCAAIAGIALPSLSPGGNGSLSLENFNCAAAQSIPENATLELTKTAWNPGLARWEFSMRCTRARDCVPFLVWARATSADQTSHSESAAMALPSLREFSGAYLAVSGGLIKAGQTATLRWDEAGIRIVLPVTCLDGGNLGQTVRVQFKNARRILRAEILSDGTLRAGL